jgi:hypothetical protein
MAFAIARGIAARESGNLRQAEKKMDYLPQYAHVTREPGRQRKVISPGKQLIN